MIASSLPASPFASSFTVILKILVNILLGSIILANACVLSKRLDHIGNIRIVSKRNLFFKCDLYK